MTEKKQKQSLNLDAEFLNLIDPVVCKVEVDLANLLFDLSGGKRWVIESEHESESYVSFFLKHADQEAEVTLYNSGYASIDIDGESVFHGDILEKKGEKAKLHYYRLDNGERILVN